MEWQEKRRLELASVGVTDPLPQWKRLEADEYEAWALSLTADDLKSAHRHCAAQQHNPAAPVDGNGEPGVDAIHWCDINQPYIALD